MEGGGCYCEKRELSEADRGHCDLRIAGQEVSLGKASGSDQRGFNKPVNKMLTFPRIFRTTRLCRLERTGSSSRRQQVVRGSRNN